MIKDLLKNKSAKQKANIKGKEIAKIDFRGEHTSVEHGIKIDITEIKAIEGGVAVLAKAWKGNKQLGFGKDGSVEIERFLIYNPPILVDDTNGDITIEKVSPEGETKIRKLKEDPQEAIRQVIAHNCLLVGKEDTNIIKGKVGNTTSTFFPSGDGMAGQTNENATWASIHGAVGDADGFDNIIQVQASTTTDRYIHLKRSLVVFDTSAIDDGDDLDSAILSIKGDGGFSSGFISDGGIGVYASAPASNTAIVAGDYDSLSSTILATQILFSAWSDSAFNDFTLNAAGEALVDFTGHTKLGFRESVYDAPDNEPTWVNDGQIRKEVFWSDTSGTTQDPKLVITHSVAAVFTPRVIMY